VSRRRVEDGRAAAPDQRRLGAVLEFMRLLWAVDHGLQSVSRRMAARLGVTGPQRLVIRMVGRYPEISPGDLAGILHVHPSTLTGVLRRLERRGLIERSADPGDRRRARLRLSDGGARLDDTRRGTVEAAVRRALERIPPRRLEAAASALRVLGAGLPVGSPRRRRVSPRRSGSPPPALRPRPGRRPAGG
jgi:DNA-binding MarR family transcriptional regulator